MSSTPASSPVVLGKLVSQASRSSSYSSSSTSKASSLTDPSASLSAGVVGVALYTMKEVVDVEVEVKVAPSISSMASSTVVSSNGVGGKTPSGAVGMRGVIGGPCSFIGAVGPECLVGAEGIVGGVIGMTGGRGGA